MVEPGGASGIGDPDEIRLEGSCYVEVLQGPEVGRRYPLPLPRASIGRAPANAVCIPDASISSHHAEIVEIEGEVLLRDLGSRNGTLLEGESIVEEPLRSGDTIQIGRVRLRYVDPAAGEPREGGETGGAAGAGPGGGSAGLPLDAGGEGAGLPGGERILHVRDAAVPVRRGGLATFLLALLALAGSTGVFFWVRALAPVIEDSEGGRDGDLLAMATPAAGSAAKAWPWRGSRGVAVSAGEGQALAWTFRLDGTSTGSARLDLPVALDGAAALHVTATLTLLSGTSVGLRLAWTLPQAELSQDVLLVRATGAGSPREATVVPPPGALAVQLEVVLAGEGVAATLAGLHLDRAPAATGHGSFTPFLGAGRVSWLRRREAWFLDLGPVARDGVSFTSGDDEKGTHLRWVLPGSSGETPAMHVRIPLAMVDRVFLHEDPAVVSLRDVTAPEGAPGDRSEPATVAGIPLRAITVGTGLGRVRIVLDEPARLDIVATGDAMDLRWVSAPQGGEAPGAAGAMGVTLVTEHDEEKAAALRELLAARREADLGHPGEAFRRADAIARAVPFDPGLRAEARRVAETAAETCRSRLAPVEERARTALLVGHPGSLEIALAAVRDLAAPLRGFPGDTTRAEIEARLLEALRAARALEHRDRAARLDRLREAALEAGWGSVVSWIDEVRSREES